jgi:hypothetical protein
MLEERNCMGTRGSVSRSTVDWDISPFSWEQWICSILSMIMRKVAIHGLHEIRMVECHTQIERRRHIAC